MAAPDLVAAESAVDVAEGVVANAVRLLAGRNIDEHQVVAYDIAHAAAALDSARTILDYGGSGDLEARLATAFVADAVADLIGKVSGREDDWDAKPDTFESTLPFVATTVTLATALTLWPAASAVA